MTTLPLRILTLFLSSVVNLLNVGSFSRGEHMERQQTPKPVTSTQLATPTQSTFTTSQSKPVQSGNFTQENILQLQRTHGNRFVAQLLDKGQATPSTRQLQRQVHYTEGATSTKHPPLSLDKKPHTMLIIGKAGASLSSSSFASCVGVTFLDTTSKWGAIAHFWAGVGTGDEVESELNAVIETITSADIAINKEQVTVALHVGANSEHKFSTQRAARLREILSNHGKVGGETSGSSVSIQVPE